MKHSVAGFEGSGALRIDASLCTHLQVIIDVHFPHVIYKKLKQLPPCFADLEDSMPTLAKSLRQLLDYDGDVESDICRTFEVIWAGMSTFRDNGNLHILPFVNQLQELWLSN